MQAFFGTPAFFVYTYYMYASWILHFLHKGGIIISNVCIGSEPKLPLKE